MDCLLKDNYKKNEYPKHCCFHQLFYLHSDYKINLSIQVLQSTYNLCHLFQYLNNNFDYLTIEKFTNTFPHLKITFFFSFLYIYYTTFLFPCQPFNTFIILYLQSFHDSIEKRKTISKNLLFFRNRASTYHFYFIYARNKIRRR